LEPRILLSADLSFTMGGTINDLTLGIEQVDDVDTIQLIDTDSGSVVESRALAETGSIEIIDSAEDDVLRLGGDFSALMDSLSILFEGGGGSDALFGPSVDTLWQITGADSGLVAGVHFAGVENLTGNADFVDRFVFENGARLSGILDGGGGEDSLEAGLVSDDLLFTIRTNGTVSVGTAPDTWSSLGIIPEEVLSLLTDGLKLENVQNVSRLVGGSGDNTFSFQEGASFSGTLDGAAGATNTLDYLAFSGAVTVNFVAGTATGTDGIANMNRVVGKKDKLTVTGTGAEETTAYSDEDGVIASLLTSIGLKAIEGTPGDDVLTGNDGINILNGKGGDDLLIGGDGSDIYAFMDGWGVDTIQDSGGFLDTLDFTLCTTDLTFTIHTDGSVSVTDGTNALSRVEGIEVIIDGQGNDRFVFEDGAVFNGTIGKPNWLDKLLGASLVDYGSNTLDLSAYTNPVYVDLGITVPYLEQVLWQQAWDTFEDAPIVLYFSNISNVFGGSGDDVILGNDQANILKGGGGDDVIYGRRGADTFDGGPGDDIFFGSYSEADLIALIGIINDPATIADQLGISPLDLLQHIAAGGTIQSYIFKIFAGEGDVVTYADAPGPVEVNLGMTLTADDLMNLLTLEPEDIDEEDILPHSDGAAGHDYIIGIHNVIGSRYDDVLRGNFFDNVLVGGAGNDELYGGLGSDTLIGGLGDDLLDGGGEVDETLVGDRDIASYIYATDGVRVDLNIDGSQDTRKWEIISYENDAIGGLVEGYEYEVVEVNGDAFKLKTRSGGSVDLLLAPPGGAHRFTCEGGSKSFTPATPGSIDYASGKITILGHGFSDDDVITYDAAGNDRIGGLVDGQSYKVVKVDGDTFSLKDLDGAALVLSLLPPGGTHGFEKEGIPTSFTPNDGSVDYDEDTLTIAGHGFINGDIVTYSAGGEKIYTSLGEGRDTLVNMEGLTGSNYDDILIGNDAHNIIRGGAGNDLLVSGKGYDVVTGGAGSDTISYENFDTGVFVNIWNPLPQIVTTGVDTVTLKEIENVIGSAYDDVLIGDFGNNVLEGGYGNDWLTGAMGSDVYRFQDGWGSDKVIDDIEALIDHIDQADVIDTVKAWLTQAANWLSSAIDTIDVLDILEQAEAKSAEKIPDKLDFSQTTADLTVRIHGTGDVSVNYGANEVVEVSEMEVVVTGAGSDTFIFEDGESFNGTLDGGGVNYTRYPDALPDVNTLDYSAYTTAIVVDLLAPEDGKPGEAQGTKGVYNIHDVIGGSADDTLRGDDKNNLLMGGAGNDLIEGRGGDDISATNTVTDYTVADASNASGAFGGVLAFSYVEQTTSAFIAGNTTVKDDGETLNEADSIAISAISDSTVTTIAKAAAGGASESSSGDTNTERQLDRTGAGTSEGSIGIAAAVAITDLISNTQAYVDTDSGSALVSDGNIDIHADSANRGRATADATAKSASSAAVGVAVGLNFADIDSKAYIGGAANLTADDVAAKATIDGRDWGFDPSEVVADTNEAAKTFDPTSAVNTSDETISITGHGFSTGDVVKYETGGGTDTAIKNLTNGAIYYVIRVDEDTVKLAKSYADATASTPVPVDLDTGATGSSHSLTKINETIDLGLPHGFQTGDAVVYDAGKTGDTDNTPIGGLEDGKTYYVIAVDPQRFVFNPSGTDVVDSETDETIDLGVNHALKTGDRVVYGKGGDSNTAIGGLEDGDIYYVIAVEGEPTKVKLAETADNAEAGTAVDLTSTGSGDNHTITEAAPTKVRLASSSDNAEKGIAIDLTVGDATGEHTLTEKASSFIAEAVSGASASDSVGVAGSLALNVVTTNAEAFVASGASLELHGANLVLEASSKTQITAKATPKEAATGESVGIGASAALNIGDNITKAEIQDSAAAIGASDITLSAKGSHKMTTQAKGGAEGGVAITPVVAISLANNDTIAQIGSASGGLSLTGNLDVTADHSSTASTKAEGDTTSTGDAAIGASLALSLVGDLALASTARSVTAGGNISFEAKSSGKSKSDAKASAKGGRTSSSSGGSTVDSEASTQRSGVDATAASRGARTSGTTTTPSASSSDGPVTVAAAIGINLTDSTARASIQDGTTINAGGSLSLLTNNTTSAYATADGSAVKGDVGIGAAVSVNKTDIANEAYIGDADVQAEGVSVQAQETVTPVEFNSSSSVDGFRTGKTFDPNGTDIVDATNDTIKITSHEFTTGDIVEYKTGGDTYKPIGNLKSGTVYYVIRVDDNTVKLAKSYKDAQAVTAIDINTDEAPTGTEHKLVNFHETIDLGEGHGLKTGDLVLYRAGEGAPVGGLADGEIYYVVVDDADSNKVRLAASRGDVPAMKVVDLAQASSGFTHELIRLNTYSAEATSGAGGKDVCVAGSLALNITNNKTTAWISENASVNADGTDADTIGGDVLLNAESVAANLAAANATVTGDGDVGVGASVAVNVADNDTLASIESGASISGADDVTLSARGAYWMFTEAKGGAEGGTAVTPVVAISVAQNDTVAEVQDGGGIALTGDFRIEAAQEARTETVAEGSTKATKAAVGASLGLTIAEDTVGASLMRDASVGGSLLVSAENISLTDTTAKAGAKGAAQESSSEDNKVQEQTDAQVKEADKRSGKDEGTTKSPDTSTSDGAVSVAAAIGINIATASTTATIGGTEAEPLTIEAQGPVTVRSAAQTDSGAEADGSATTTGDGTTVGAAVAVNVSDTQNHARVEYADVTGDGVVVEAVMADRDIDAPMTSLPVVDTDKETIFLGLDAGLKTGDKVMYYNGGGGSIGGLTSIGDLSSFDNLTGSYYVNVGKDGTVKLYDTEENAKAGGSGIGSGLQDLTSKGSGEGHKFYKWVKLSSYSAPNLFSPIEFDPAGNVRVLNLGADCGLNTGDVVKYDPAGDTAITYDTTDDPPVPESLDGDTTYYIIDLTGGRYQLAESRKDAFKGKAIDLTGDGNTNQQIIDRTSGSRAVAKSGAGGGKIGVAGSVAVNIATGDTSAVLGDGAIVTARDGADGDSDTGASIVGAEANTYTFTQALPKEAASGTSLGLGLSFAIGIGAHDTDASITSGATVASAGDLTVSATGDHAMISKAKAGAGAKSSSGTNVAGAVALSVANNNTDALVDAAESALEISGDLAVLADSSQIQSTEADADAKSGQTGVGVAFAMGWVEDDTSAGLLRSVSTGDATAEDVKVEATSAVEAKTVAKGSAQGSKSKDKGGKTADQETQDKTNYANSKAGTSVTSPDAGSQVDSANTTAADQTSNPGGQGGTGQQSSTQTQGGTVRVAAAIGATVVKPEVTATIADGLTIDADGDLSVKAINDADADTQATGIAFSGDAETAVGAAVAINVGLVDATATLGDGTTTAGSVAIESGTTTDETNDFKVMAVAGGGSTQKGENDNTAVAGAASVNVIVANTSAGIADSADVTTLTGDVDVMARQDIRVQNVAGGAALTLSDEGTSVGAAIGVNYVDSTTTAAVGDLAVVDSAGSVNVLADASITPIEFTVPMADYTIDKIKMTNLVLGAAIGSGGDAGAGSAAINVFTPITRASIGAGADIHADSDVTVKAVDDTKITDFAGALAGSKEGAGVGIGLDVTVVTKTTEALIKASNNASSPTTVDAGGNVIVDADSSEDYFQLTANIGAGESTSGAGGLNVLVNVTDTRAILGRDPALTEPELGNVEVDAGGSVVVAADSTTLIESYAGTAGVSFSDSAVGISVGVLVDIDETRAAIGDGADITALGGGDAVEVRDGVFDDDGNQGTESVRGLAVTATSFEDVTLLAIAASASLGMDNSGNESISQNSDGSTTPNDGGTSVGIAGSVGVAVMHGETKATLGDGVEVNADNTGANAGQGILLRAADKTNLLNITGGISFAWDGDAGVTGSVTVNDIENFVWAKALGNNTLNTKDGGVTLDADAKVDILAVTISVAGVVNTGSGSEGNNQSGSISFTGAGSVTVDIVETEAIAEIGAGSSVDTTGNLTLAAEDSSVIQADSGGVAITVDTNDNGNTAGAIGASVAVNDITQTITAKATDTSITSGNFSASATNNASITALTIAGSAGMPSAARGPAQAITSCRPRLRA